MPLERLPAGAQRLLRGVDVSLSTYRLNAFGDHVAPTAPSVVVTRADGSAVAAGSPTFDATTKEITSAIPAAVNSQLDWLKATWTDSGNTWDSYHEIVGGFYFSTATAQAHDPNLRTDKISAEHLRAVRDEVERELESAQCCDRAFVPRYRRVRVDGTGTGNLVLPDVDVRVIRSVEVFDTATTSTLFTVGELDAIAPASNGVVMRGDGGVWPCGRQNIVVAYEHGIDRPPSDLLRAILRRARYLFGQPTSGMPEKATTFTANDAGTYSLLVEGRAGAITALPDVDLLIKRYRFYRPGIA